MVVAAVAAPLEAISPQDDARLLILGGHNSRAALSDAHVLMVETMTWVEPTVGGVAPVCGNRHAAVLLEDKVSSKDGAVLVFAADMHDTFSTLYALRFTGELQSCRASGSGGTP